MRRILIIDDDDGFRDGLSETVTDLGYQVSAVARPKEGLDLLSKGQFAAALVDFRLPDMTGLELLKAIRSRPNPPPVVIITAYADSQNTIEAMRLGAFDHLTKPVHREGLRVLLAQMIASPPAKIEGDEEGSETESGEADSLVGCSPAMREIEKLIGLASNAEATVLITGETGTGKEVVAQVLHGHSLRRERPFITINCAAIPSEMLESELFGHVKGAFTGAIADQPGSFKRAHLGTLLLDEIGDMSLSMQAKILRVLQEREIQAVGSGRPEKVDVRILAATHRDLRQLIANGQFREDLYYRLNVFPIHIPPLRERQEDILPMAKRFLHGSARLRQKILSPEAAKLLREYPWPGNVRELKNVIERVSVLVRGQLITASDLAFLGDRGPAGDQFAYFFDLDLPTAVSKLERLLVERALVKTQGNRTEAAKLLGINRQLLYSKLSDFKL